MCRTSYSHEAASRKQAAPQHSPRRLNRPRHLRMIPSDDDATWFAEHPGLHTRIRDYVPGELPADRVPVPIRMVLVQQLAPGIRRKVYIPTDPEEMDGAA